jgi:hypothetical protein
MRRHYILWKFKEGVTPEQIDEAFRHVDGLATAVPGIISIRNGPNLAPRGGGYSHFSEMLFENANAHQAYNTHPAHVDVANNHTRPIAERALSLDFDEE